MAAPPIPCPICKKPVSLDDPNMPFCSDRCRLIDLGNWATEKYSIPGAPLSEDAKDDSAEPEGPSR
jgi:endogenous inhibitor of DNA gyrase (YacG/DUF329 family)